MSIIDIFLAGLAPYNCLGCGVEGKLICGGCRAGLPAVSERCYRCYAPSPASLTCNDCLTLSSPQSVRVVTIYKGVAKDILWKLKSGGAQAAAREMASLLLPLTKPNADTAISTPTLVVHLPTATTRVRQRGYDQARLLARALARQARLSYADVLTRSGQSNQVGATRAERLVQLDGAFRVNSAWQVRGAHILLVDDVLTTGASFEAATKALRQAGAAQVDAIAFARA